MTRDYLFGFHLTLVCCLCGSDTQAASQADGSGCPAWTHYVIDMPLPGKAWGTAGIPLADLDGDGDLDAALSRRDSHGFYWYERLDDDRWRRHTIRETTEIEQGLGAAVSDLNGDGWLDLVFCDVWFEHPGRTVRSGGASWRTHAFPGRGHDILATDINQDHQEDLVVFDGDDLVWYDPAQGMTQHAIGHDIGHHGGVTPKGAGDLDGDGDPDLVVAGYWFANPGRPTGDWTRHRWPHRVIANASYGTSIRSWVADLDADGDNDIVYSDCDTGMGHVYWVENLGAGHDWTSRQLADPPPAPNGVPGTGSWHSLAVADFDMDGDLDVFGGEQEDPDTYMEGDGKLAMKPPGLQERGVVWLNSGSNPPSLLPHVIQVDNPGWHDVSVGDVDGDGDPDLVSKIWNKDGEHYHADYWRNDRILSPGVPRSPSRSPSPP